MIHIDVKTQETWKSAEVADDSAVTVVIENCPAAVMQKLEALLYSTEQAHLPVEAEGTQPELLVQIPVMTVEEKALFYRFDPAFLKYIREGLMLTNLQGLQAVIKNNTLTTLLEAFAYSDKHKWLCGPFLDDLHADGEIAGTSADRLYSLTTRLTAGEYVMLKHPEDSIPKSELRFKYTPEYICWFTLGQKAKETLTQLITNWK